MGLQFMSENLRVYCVAFVLIPVVGLSVAMAAPSPVGEQGPYAPPASPRQIINFNPAWKFIRQDVAGAENPSFDDSKWTTVSTPHSFNDVDSFRTIISHSGGDRGTFKGVVWYRKHFKLPAEIRRPQALPRVRGHAPSGRLLP